MDKAYLGVFTDRDNAENAINELQNIGLNPKDISIVMKDTGEGKKIASDTGARIDQGAVKGVATGAVIGGIAGLLIGVGAIAIPGIGALLIGGPIAADLGLTGAAATAASGAVTGAVAGGIIGALTKIGVSEEEAKRYEERVKAGAILLAVPAIRGKEDDIEGILSENGADNIRTITMPSEEAATERVSKHSSSAKIHTAHHDYHVVNPIQVEKYLRHVDYPAEKEDLIKSAEEEGADENVIHTLEDLPEDKFNGPKDVSRAIGRIS